MASIASNSTKTISLKRPSDDPLLAKDINILDRLVWVRNDGVWFPAIIYKSYSEVQEHLYKYLDTRTKVQFAMAIMLEMNSNRRTKVARLLGKSSVELISLEEDEYHEFYWNLAKMIRKGSDLSRYQEDVDLYLEFHQALDEVLEIFYIYSRRKSQGFELITPDSGYRSWYDAARARLGDEREEEEDARDLRYDYFVPGDHDSRDEKGQTSCLKKDRKWSTSKEIREPAAVPPSKLIRGRRKGEEDGSRSDHNQKNKPSHPRSTTNVLKGVKSLSVSESKNNNVRFGRAQQSIGSARNSSKSDKKSSKPRIVWE
ncbi:MAG: hypothetical protein SGILL_000525 [Bacillariaceae sp.]